MARKPNYRFERHERERAKAAKKAARLKAKADRLGVADPDAPDAETTEAETPDSDTADGGPAELTPLDD